MWHLSAHMKTLRCRYVFKELALEARYQEQVRPLRIGPICCHCLLVLAYCLVGLASPLTYRQSPPLVWMHSTVVCATVLVLACARAPRARRHLIPIHALYCVAVGAINAGIIFPETAAKKADVVTRWIPELQSLPPEPFAFDLLHHFDAYITWQLISSSFLFVLLKNVLMWVALSLVGLHCCTLVAYLTSTLSLALCVLTVPGHLPSVAIGECVVTVVVGCALLGSCIVLERAQRSMFLAETQLENELHASQQADSILNHTLKNILADVAANLEVFLAQQVGPGILQDCIACLRRGMRSCKERQVYLKLVAGDYAPVLNQVSVQEFGEELVAGRCMVHEPLELNVFMDCALLNLILENAISNAVKHGHPSDPNVRLVVRDVSALAPQPLPPGWCRLQFSVINTANPTRPALTRADTQRLFNGKLDTPVKAVAPTLSDRIGISHCVIAAQLAGIDLSLTQEAGLVTFSACLDVQTLPTLCLEDQSQVQSDALEVFPPGLRFLCIDDSPAARRLLEFHLKQWCSPAGVLCLGATEDDVARFVPLAMEGMDVVLIDQHLEFSTTYHGTDLIARLVELGFPGLICVRSANDSPEDRQRYCDSGAHCAFGKDMLGRRMVQELKLAFLQLKGVAPSNLSTSQQPSRASFLTTPLPRQDTTGSVALETLHLPEPWLLPPHPFGAPPALPVERTGRRRSRRGSGATFPPS